MAANTIRTGLRSVLGGVSILALTIGAAAAKSAAEQKIEKLQQGAYLSGDFHNHTTCTDGAMSVTTVVNESLVTYGLDWFAQTGHGGEGPRDCRFDDPEYDGAVSGDGAFWEVTVGPDAIKGDVENTTGFGGFGAPGGSAQEMWRWQILNEYAFQMQRDAGQLADAPAWLGVEHNAPGHEHVSMAIIQQVSFRNRGRRLLTTGSV